MSPSVLWISLALYAVACIAAIAAVPLATRLALQLGLIDRPNARKVNKRPNIPLMGGLVIAIGLGVGLTALQLSPAAVEFEGRLLALGLGATILMVVGGIDDRYGLSASTRLIFQAIAAGIAISAGFTIEHITNPFTRETIVFDDYPVLVWLLTGLFIVALTNAINFLDGIDGLSTGLTLIIAATLTILFAHSQEISAIYLGVAFMGALSGFLPFNYPPARMFLGDMGAYLLGYTLALLTLEGFRQLTYLPLTVPLVLVLMVPILDMASSIIRRLRHRGKVHAADRRHLHHRMLDVFGSQRQTVNRIYMMTLAFCTLAIAIFRTNRPGVWISVSLLIVLGLTLNFARNFDLIEAGEANDRSGGPGQPEPQKPE